MVPFIGLTGGIGAGKSTALAALDRLGAATLSTDQVVHALYGTPEVRDAVAARFGDDVAPGGIVDRGTVAARAFATPLERAWLEGLLWPKVRARMGAWREQLERSGTPLPAAVVEVPLLFESGIESLFDATIVVMTDEPVRAERAAARGHVALEHRSSRQLSPAEKAARASYVIRNDGTVEELEQQLSAVLDKLLT